MYRVKAFFRSRWFDPRYKFKVHMGQLVLVAVIMALAIGKLATRPSYIPMSRMDIVAITMSVKTLMLLAYQLLTEHVWRFKRWASLKAYAIINTLEIVFWFVVVGLTFQSVSLVCEGVSCAFGCLVALLALVMVAVCFWTAVVTWTEYSHFRHSGVVGRETLPYPNAPYNHSISDLQGMKP